MFLADLYKDLPVYQKPGRGNYSYVKSVDVMDRMNKVFAGRWNSEVVMEKQTDKCVVLRVRVTVEDSNNFFYHEGFGSQQLFDQHLNDLGQAYKSAYSKALRDACRKWGVGLYLEEDGEENMAITSPISPATSTKMSDIKSRMPNVPKQVPSIGDEVSEGEGQKMPPPPPGRKIATSFEDTPQGRIASKKEQETRIPMPPVPQEEDNVIGEGEQGQPVLPKMPVPPSVPPRTTPVKEDKETPSFPSKSPVFEPNNDEMPISDVQKVALNGQLKLRKLDYEELVAAAFSHHGIEVNEIPPMENLTYQQAVKIIGFANEVYKNK